MLIMYFLSLLFWLWRFPDEPGSLSEILHTLANHDISLEYTYAFITRQEKVAYMVFRVG